ncbi:YczE/YyaS/YitT family protein [Savagea faecisuis]|uniref:YitT family protein n=1 Tax=Savagea faecisuis TaxID=1274803 RepID=A0ABW3GT17_9BACL
MNRTVFWRWAFYLGGMIILSFGIGMTIRGERFGIGPWDVFHYGLTETIGLTIGMWSIITGFLIILITALFTRKFPKIGTWINMVVIGTFIDISLLVLPETPTFATSLTSFVLGVIVMGIGVGIYIAPNLGAGPRDSLMLLFMDKLNMSINTARTLMEVLVAIGGWFLGGPVGIGTVLIAFGLGSFVQLAMPYSTKVLKRLIPERDHYLLNE